MVAQQHEHRDEHGGAHGDPDRLVARQRGIDAAQLDQANRHEHPDERQQVGVGVRRQQSQRQVHHHEYRDDRPGGGQRSQVQAVRLRRRNRHRAECADRRGPHQEPGFAGTSGDHFGLAGLGVRAGFLTGFGGGGGGTVI